MDELWPHVQAALLALWDKVVAFCLHLLDAAGRKALDLAALAAGWVQALAARVAAVPLWVSAPLAVLLIGLAVCYVFRQRLYDRLLIYYDVWLRRQGYVRQVFRVRRGAVREEREAMAREIVLPPRFEGLALYEVAPDRYAAAYGRVNGSAEAVRFYRRDRRAGLEAMGADLIRYFRTNARLLHADGEVRALFAVLDARDPDFAACRPALPGEIKKKTARGVLRAVRHSGQAGSSTG